MSEPPHNYQYQLGDYYVPYFYHQNSIQHRNITYSPQLVSPQIIQIPAYSSTTPILPPKLIYGNMIDIFVDMGCIREALHFCYEEYR